jgi:hypothetical protein
MPNMKIRRKGEKERKRKRDGEKERTWFERLNKEQRRKVSKTPSNCFISLK